jgi:putative inorganic carbon (HCO3(-)) transporter
MFLLVLLTAVMLIRPGEVFPDLEGLPIYYWVILVNIVLNFDKVIAQLNARVLLSRPMLCCIFGILFARIMSHLTMMRTYEAREAFEEFSKIIIFYLIYTGVVVSKSRVLTMMKCIALFSVIEVGMAVADYLEYYDFPAIKSVSETFTDPQTGEITVYSRMCGTGLFEDPNDLCMLITVGSSLCFYLMTRQVLSFFWSVPLVFLIYSITLTHSRGGLLSLIAAALAIFVSKYGWRKMFPLILCASPVVLLLGGRQASISTSEGTGQARIQLWSYGFTAIVTEKAPLFGVGFRRYPEYAGLDAHNSFIQTYVETGFFGGTCFFAMFYYSVVNLIRVNRQGDGLIDPDLVRMQPYLMGIIVGVITSMMSLTRERTVVGYLFTGLIECYFLSIAAQVPGFMPRLDRPQFQRILKASAICFIVLYLYTRASARFSGNG